LKGLLKVEPSSWGETLLKSGIFAMGVELAGVAKGFSVLGVVPLENFPLNIESLWSHLWRIEGDPPFESFPSFWRLNAGVLTLSSSLKLIFSKLRLYWWDARLKISSSCCPMAGTAENKFRCNCEESEPEADASFFFSLSPENSLYDLFN